MKTILGVKDKNSVCPYCRRDIHMSLINWLLLNPKYRIICIKGVHDTCDTFLCDKKTCVINIKYNNGNACNNIKVVEESPLTLVAQRYDENSNSKNT